MNKKDKPVIAFGVGLFDIKSYKDITHHVTGFRYDVLESSFYITIEKGISVQQLRISSSEASSMGLVNIEALSEFCKD